MKSEDKDGLFEIDIQVLRRTQSRLALAAPWGLGIGAVANLALAATLMQAAAETASLIGAPLFTLVAHWWQGPRTDQIYTGVLLHGVALIRAVVACTLTGLVGLALVYVLTQTRMRNRRLLVRLTPDLGWSQP